MRLLEGEMRRFLLATAITAGLLYTGILPTVLLAYGTFAAMGIVFAGSLAALEILKRTRSITFLALMAFAGLVAVGLSINFAVTPIAALTYGAIALAGMLVAKELLPHLRTSIFICVLAASIASGMILGGMSLPLLAPIIAYGVVATIPATTLGLLGLYAGIKLSVNIGIPVIETTLQGLTNILFAVIDLPAYLHDFFKAKPAAPAPSPMPNIHQAVGADKPDPDSSPTSLYPTSLLDGIDVSGSPKQYSPYKAPGPRL